MKKLMLFSILFCISSLAYTASLPKGSRYDSRVQKFIYNPDDVVRIKTKVGISTLIQLEEGENILSDNAGLGIGDKNAWSVAVKGNNIFIKPIAENPDTNITLVSNKRTYMIYLELVKDEQLPSFLVRFEYPKPKKAYEPKKPSNLYKALQNNPCNNNYGYSNYRYYKWGNEQLAPMEAWDDGQFTCFRFIGSNEMPAIYKKLADGTEVLTNTNIENDVVVVHEVAKEFRLRSGNLVLGIKNDRVVNLFNYNGTNSTKEREIREAN